LIALKVFYWFLKAIFCGLFQVGNKQWRIAGKELISKPTFRLPDSAHTDCLIGFRMLKRSVANLSQSVHFPLNKISVLVYDGTVKSFNKRKTYLIWVKKYNENEIFGLGRDNAFLYTNKSVSLVLLLFLSVGVFPFTILSKNRAKWALIFSEFIETSGLISFINKTRVKNLHFFSPAEKDSNVVYLLLHKFGVNVTKHPSPGALVAHNKNLMTDTLALSSLYQKEEYKIMLRKTIRCSSTEFWHAESSIEYIHLYNEKDEKHEFDFILGFYSHGGWLRKKTGLSQALFAKPNEEENCLKIVSQFVNENNIKLKIYLHPNEKEYLTEAKEYYKSFLSENNIVYYTDSLPSSFDFKSVKIGVCAYSAILFERDNLNFETFVWREQNNNFPLEGSSLHRNSFNNYSEFVNLLNSKRLVC
jgi:hypothetical protein